MAASAADMSHATTVPSVLQPQSAVNGFYIVAVFDFVILIFFPSVSQACLSYLEKIGIIPTSPTINKATHQIALMSTTKKTIMICAMSLD
jgi:hypothetical protein